jgi:phosphoribosyl 1,2-cyclic phosphodiesterase
MKDFRFLAKIYGVRGSYPIAPKTGTEFGGNTTCMYVRTKDHIVIFDAGSGIIDLGKELVPEILTHQKKSKEPFHLTILFTHTHIDHLIGFPYFAPLFFPNVIVHLIGPATMGVDFEEIIRTLLEPQYFPISLDEFRSTKYFENLTENTLLQFREGEAAPRLMNVWDSADGAELVIRNMKYYLHPKDGSYNFRIEWHDRSIVFATDVEQFSGTDQRLLKFAEGSDILIHDAQYDMEQYLNSQGYGHSNYEMACQLALKAKVKKLLLFHHDPNNDDDKLKDIEKEAKEIFSGAEVAKEGWEWKL